MKTFFTIDSGNTSTSIYRWNNNQFSKYQQGIDIALETGDKIILCDVANKDISSKNIVNISSLYNQNTFLDMPVKYNETLGMDRLAGSYYIYKQENLEESILIDCGTFTKIEKINGSGYEGGYILPGIELIKKTYKSGVQLKNYELSFGQNSEIPQTTLDAMEQGLFHTAISPIINILNSNNSSDIYVTGGNAETIFKYLEQYMQQGASIHLDMDLIHKSLALIASKVLK